MCGILGYVGNDHAFPLLLDGLKAIAYRGYDSCGITTVDAFGLHMQKSVGAPETLQTSEPPLQSVGIAHTRWATHGEPSFLNAHPHIDCRSTVAVAHNGIIENFAALKIDLQAAGHEFRSQTDTEVLPHLIETELDAGVDLVRAVRNVAGRLEGSFAFIAVSVAEPELVVGARNDCPLNLGRTADGSIFLTSDPAAILEHCQDIIFMKDGQVAAVRKDSIELTDFNGVEQQVVSERLEWTCGQAQRGGFAHYMLKEIHEQPKTVRDLLRERITPHAETNFPELDLILPADLDQVVIVACGTASYAASFGKTILEQLTSLPVRAEVGSEYRYGRHALSPRSLFIAISQSGETADTIASLRSATEAGAAVLSVVNVVGTSIAREGDAVVYTRGGPENAVPSTKVFMNQLAMMMLIAAHLGRKLGDAEKAKELIGDLTLLPEMLTQTLQLEPQLAGLAKSYSYANSWFVIGRGLDEPLAREAALKLKEVAYIHAEAMPAGELKHGPIAMIDELMPVLALVTQPNVRSKMVNNIQEVAARRGRLITFTTLSTEGIDDVAMEVVRLPHGSAFIDPLIAAIPIQLLSYYCGVERDTNIDYPRNLAKSVTVE